jgi:hypothetical protein
MQKKTAFCYEIIKPGNAMSSEERRIKHNEIQRVMRTKHINKPSE